MKLNLLDCTFRDGGYYNNWNFSTSLANNYLKTISKTSIQYVEIGFRGILFKNKNKGKFWYSTKYTVSKLKKYKNIKLGVMINASDYILKNGSIDKKSLEINFKDKKIIDFVRIAFHIPEYKNAIDIGKILKSYNYLVGLNLMQISRCNKTYLNKITKKIKGLNPHVFYIADSLGDLKSKKLLEITKIIRKNWSGDLGIHAHDNLKLALKNTIYAKKLGYKWLDSTILGMGRGPGNTKTEQLLRTLKLQDGKVQLNNFIKKNFKKFFHFYKWGTNKYYEFSAKNNIHPTFVQEMLSDDRYASKDIQNVLKRIKNSYFYNPNILDNFNKRIKINYSKHNMSQIILKNKVLIVANTNNFKNNIKKIKKFISLYNPSIISLNPNTNIDSEKIDYIIACNDIRIYADLKKYLNINSRIVLPFRNIDKNILKKLKKNKFINIESNFFSHTDFRFDNNSIFLPKKLSMPYALSICDLKGVKEIYLAGFEGYKNNILKRKEIQQLLSKFLKIKKRVKKINFLTKSLYKV